MRSPLETLRTAAGRMHGILVPVAVGVSSALVFSRCSPDKAAGGFSMPPMPVEVAPAAVQTVVDRFEAVGTIEAQEAVTVVSEIDGAVMQIPFVEGSYLAKGALIARLDDAQLAAEVTRASALHEQSHAVYERVKAIVEQQAGAPQDLDDAAAALKVADANLALAKARFAKTRILAPFSGIVGARKVSTGTFLRSGQPITELANIDDIRVGFSVPERFLGRIAREAEVSVTTTAFPGYGLKGSVVAIEPVLDPGTRSARIVARLPNPGRKFRPGMSANIALVLSERAGAITIPNEAVFANGNQSFVYVVSADSVATRVPVELGTRLTNVVEVLRGLSPGMNVVQAGHQKLFDGAKVLPVAANTVGAAHP